LQLDEADREHDIPRLSVSSKEASKAVDKFMLCPRFCGASWAPNGQLVYFNNFPKAKSAVAPKGKKLGTHNVT
jgi:serine/threonine protein kinase HipA of HipAB toxin-antitoxin module